MGKVLYNYNVLDTTTMEYTLKNVPLADVCDTIGIPKDKVSAYAESGYIYDGKYHITRCLVDSNKPIERIVTPMPPEWQDEWDKWRKVVNPEVIL